MPPLFLLHALSVQLFPCLLHVPLAGLFSPPFGWHIHRFGPGSSLLDKVCPGPLHLAIQPTLSSLKPSQAQAYASLWARETQQPKRHLVHRTPRRPRRPRWRISGQADSWLKKPKQVPREAQRGADLWLVGYSSTVITSSAFQAAMLVPQNRHCQPIIADSLLPKNRKKQQTAEMSMEPPAQGDQRRKKHETQVRQHLQKQVHLHTQRAQLGPPHGTPAMELEPSAWVMSPEWAPRKDFKILPP